MSVRRYLGALWLQRCSWYLNQGLLYIWTEHSILQRSMSYYKLASLPLTNYGWLTGNKNMSLECYRLLDLIGQVHCNPVQGQYRVFPVKFSHKEIPVMKTGVPAIRTRVLCNENRFFPVWKTSQGKPCSRPALYVHKLMNINLRILTRYNFIRTHLCVLWKGVLRRVSSCTVAYCTAMNIKY